MSLLSIIIPVFNVENYLEECLQSILQQECTEYEIILINNASTDNSGEICDAYASRYDNIKVVHLKVNALPAGARNVGLQIASGEYIHFCDSDDYYVSGIFSSIVKRLYESSPSVLLGQFICLPEKGAYVTHDVQLDPEVINHCDASGMAEYLLSLPNLLCTPWRFIVKRDLLTLNNITFPEGYHSEDEEWFPKVICSADTFAHLAEPFYIYRPRATGSVTSTKNFLNSKSHLVVAFNLLKFLSEKDLMDARRELIYSRVTFLMGIFNTRCDTFSDEQLQELAEIIERNSALPIFDPVLKSNNLFGFIYDFGPHEGLRRFRSFVMNNTLALVRGKENKDIYVFPTGYNGEGTARILQNSGYHVKGFLDNSEFKNDSIINGLPVNLPTKLTEKSPDELNNVFVMVTTQRQQVAEEIMKQLIKIGLDDTQFSSVFY